MIRHTSRFPLLLVIVLLNLLVSASGSAQEPIRLRLVLPQNMLVITPALLDDFHTSNPGIEVEIVYAEASLNPIHLNDIESHLDMVEAYIGSGDVALVFDSMLTVESTYAGPWLNIQPLVNSSADIDPDDFYPAAWSHFVWNEGLWALPLSINPVLMVYDPAAFDAAGQAYPSSRWTIDDFANAARALTQYDADGRVETPGYAETFYDGLLLRAFLNQPVEAYRLPDFPADPLIPVLETWRTLQMEGVVGSGGGSYLNAPMTVITASNLSGFPQPRALAVLPNNITGASVRGLALNAATAYPELALELANSLTQNTDFLRENYSIFAAREDVTFDRLMPLPEFVDDDAAITTALNEALAAADLRYADYLDQMSSGPSPDAQLSDLILSIQQRADSAVIAAQQRATEPRLAPGAAEPTPEPGTIAIDFALSYTTLPNENLWRRVIDDFTATDPEVSQINLRWDTPLGSPLLYDCVYIDQLPAEQISYRTDDYRDLRPLMAADADFDPADFVPGTLEQVTIGDAVWGYPLTVQPRVIPYTAEEFELAGLTPPGTSWYAEEFVEALRARHAAFPDSFPFSSHSDSASDLLMLIAAFGGVPIDYHTMPPTLDFTSESNVEAIRQVLDLAREELIFYAQMPLHDRNPGIHPGLRPNPIFLGSFAEVPEDAPLTRFVTLPQNRQFATLSFEPLGAAYIAAQNPNPEACYRWIATLSQHPELFASMPARLSRIDHPELATAQSEDAVAFYQTVVTQLEDPTTLVIPVSELGAENGAYTAEIWLVSAFDAYVYDGADLETVLAQAQENALATYACIDSERAANPEEDGFEQWDRCVTAIDPDLGARYGEP